MSGLRIFGVVVGLSLATYVVVALVWRVHGRVVEDSTQRPIEGAFVVGTWSAQLISIGHGSGGCYYVEFARSDSEGRFTLPQLTSLNPLRLDRQRSISVYAPGYTVRTETGDGTFVLSRRTGTPAEQFEQIHPAPTYDCVDPNDGRLLPMYKAVAEEAFALAATRRQKEAALDRLFRVDWLEVGEKEAHRRYSDRLVKLYQETGKQNEVH